ncbi:MarR family transcriptional regulator [Streptomyces sp. NPDC052052]|uniref:MarR family transcriptional regulator n=1 Tax=Streptomyces sp. NPDC052052 TaxID=3154756 RepID=UPI00342E154A
MAPAGYGKQSVPSQSQPGVDDFAFLPERERYVAGYIDRLPEGAAMDIKSLAQDLPLYGQMGIGTALRALAVAGHLRRVRCRVKRDDQCRWVTVTYWSRTAHDNEWWATHLAGRAAAPEQATAPGAAPGPEPFVPRQRTAERPLEEDAAAPSSPNAPNPQVSQTPHKPGPVASGPPAATDPSPAYRALAELGRREPRLALSAADCATLEPLAAAWLARGVSTEYLTSALTAGLPAQVDSPVGLTYRRLTKKMPPHLPTAPTPGPPGTPVHSLLVECTECGRPGPAEALPDGLCTPCHTAHQKPESPDVAAPEQDGRDVAARVANLRNLMHSP